MRGTKINLYLYLYSAYFLAIEYILDSVKLARDIVNFKCKFIIISLTSLNINIQKII